MSGDRFEIPICIGARDIIDDAEILEINFRTVYDLHWTAMYLTLGFCCDEHDVLCITERSKVHA